MMVHGKFGPPQDMAFIPAFLISGVLYLETHPSLVAEFGLTVPPPKKDTTPQKALYVLRLRPHIVTCKYTLNIVSI